MRKGFFIRMAAGNVRRSREVYVPYFCATAIIAGVYFLINALIYSEGMASVPSGEIASGVFLMGMLLFTIFAFGFMLYINNFLIKRRRKEFGLYGVLGLEKRHVCRVLLWENLMVLGAGVACGIALACVLGQLLFLLLMRLMHVAAGSVFTLSLTPFIATLLLFLAVYAAGSLYNLYQVRTANPIALLQSDKRGEKPARGVWPMALLGALLLGAAYYWALTIENPGMAIGVFFPLALLVIVATHLIFTSGSIAALRLLRANKRVYYKLNNFVSIAGMFHRMRQNAAGLAVICTLSTMLIVTVAGTTSLYLGQEEILRARMPYDVVVNFYPGDAKGETLTPEQARAVIERCDETLGRLAAAHGVTLSAADGGERLYHLGESYINLDVDVTPATAMEPLENALLVDGCCLVFDLAGEYEAQAAFVAALREAFGSSGFIPFYWNFSNIHDERADSYALFGGLLFLGAFFTVLFLAITVLIIYFKQITEGYEDKERFEILQKVGMDDRQVRATINRQILWVFFLPLAGALCHTAFATPMIARMLKSFQLYNTGITVACVAGACALFALIYTLVYRMTARAYYRIVKW